MTYEEIYRALNSLEDIPVTYYAYPAGQVPDLPFMVYYYPSSNDEIADNTNWCRIEHINIELYTDNKDIETEARVEALLNSMGLVYTRAEQYIQSEAMYEVLYESEVAITYGTN